MITCPKMLNSKMTECTFASIVPGDCYESKGI